MGKWSYLSSGDMLAKVSAKKKELVALTGTEMYMRWEAAGSPEIRDYGLNWYAGSSGDGWATLDDSASRKLFMMSCPRQAYHDVTIGIPWEKIATTACFELGITRLPVVNDVAPAMPEAPVVNLPAVENKFKTGQVFTFTWLSFDSPYQRTYMAVREVDIQAEALAYFRSHDNTLEKKMGFINEFMAHLIAIVAIVEVPIVKQYEFVNQIETDRVNEEWLKGLFN